MKNLARVGLIAFVSVVALFFACAPRAAAQDGTIATTVLDFDGKPWANVSLHLESDQGGKTDGKTDSAGHYRFTNLRPGTYKISVDLPMQNQPFLAAQVKVASGQEVPAELNLKALVADKNPEYVAALKKQGEASTKFQGMKQHFEAGTAAMQQVSDAKAALSKAPAEQRDGIKKQIADNSAKAVTEFEQAKAAAPEKDANLNLVLARLGDAYEANGRSDDAINAYKQAIELKPTAAYYDNLGSIYGRANKIDEAKASYSKAAELDPPNAGHAWLNFGITMYNAQKYQDGIEPLKKATELNPNNAQAWYLLAACMVADPSIYKQEAGKIEVTPKPGTVEAYQKAIQLDPNGPWGQQAKMGLDQLQQMTGGIDTKINTKKKKP